MPPRASPISGFCPCARWAAAPARQAPAPRCRRTPQPLRCLASQRRSRQRGPEMRTEWPLQQRGCRDPRRNWGPAWLPRGSPAAERPAPAEAQRRQAPAHDMPCRPNAQHSFLVMNDWSTESFAAQAGRAGICHESQARWCNTCIEGCLGA